MTRHSTLWQCKQQALTIEHAKIRDRPCPILFIIHTTNDGARPLHTKKGRAVVKRDVYVRDLSLFTQMFALSVQLMQLMQLMMRNDLSA